MKIVEEKSGSLIGSAFTCLTLIVGSGAVCLFLFIVGFVLVSSPKAIDATTSKILIGDSVGYEVPESARLVYARRYSESIGVSSICVVFSLNEANAEELVQRFTPGDSEGSLPVKKGCSSYLRRSQDKNSPSFKQLTLSGNNRKSSVVFFDEVNELAMFELYIDDK